MRNIEEYRTTTNTNVYNKARKKYLATSKGAICCSWCKYHQNENSRKWYGGSLPCGFENDWPVVYPSWKLVSKNRKQWMSKNQVKVTARETYRGHSYIDFDIRQKNKKYKDTNFKNLWQIQRELDI